MGGLQQKAQGKYEAQVDAINQAQAADAAHQSITAGQTDRVNFWRKVGALPGTQRHWFADELAPLGTDSTAEVTTGQTIRVDGSTGVVTILDA